MVLIEKLNCMKTKPNNDNAIPSKEELQEQDDLTRAQIKTFEQFHTFAKKTPGADSSYRMRVFCDASLLRNHETNVPKVDIARNPDSESPAYFLVACGAISFGAEAESQYGDLQFYFCQTHCEIWSWHHTAKHELSERFDGMLKELFKKEEVSSMKTLSGETLRISGDGFPEKLLFNNCLLVLKLWKELIASEIEKEQSK
jgi:hypothetical protein